MRNSHYILMGVRCAWISDDHSPNEMSISIRPSGISHIMIELAKWNVFNKLCEICVRIQHVPSGGDIFCSQ